MGGAGVSPPVWRVGVPSDWKSRWNRWSPSWRRSRGRLGRRRERRRRLGKRQDKEAHGRERMCRRFPINWEFNQQPHFTLGAGQQQSLRSSSGVDAVQPQVWVGNYQLTAAVQPDAVRAAAHGLIVCAAAYTHKHTKHTGCVQMAASKRLFWTQIK